jgi:hypothetical protein
VVEPERDSPFLNAAARFMPWVISIFLHSGVGLILMLVTTVAAVRILAPPSEIPGPGGPFPVGLLDPGYGTGPAGQMMFPGMARNGNLSTMQNRVPVADAHGWAERESSIPNRGGSGGAGDAKDRGDVIGLGAAGLPGIGLGGGSGDACGPLAPFGLGRGGHGDLPKADIFNPNPLTGFPARHICYVIDRSGSMVDSFDHVRREMVISISRLTDKQQDFHVILFCSGPPIENPPRRLVQATVWHKEEAVRFLEPVRAEQQTDPVPALNRAFDVLAQVRSDPNRPDKLIFLLTDGVFPDNAKVLDVIRGRNAGKDVAICTYLYGNRPPEAVDVLTRIAKENRGTFKYISPDEAEAPTRH